MIIVIFIIIHESALVIGQLLPQLRVFPLLNKFIPQLEVVYMVVEVVPKVFEEVLRWVG